MEKTYFDGTSFESMGIVVERVHDDLPEMREEMEANPGAHGSRVNSLTLAPRTITLECRAFGEKWSDFDALKDALAAWLVTTDDRRLALRNHPGQHYLAHYQSIAEGDRRGGTGIGGFEVTFTASDPIRYGESRAYVLKPGSYQTFEVGGTERCDMSVTVRGTSGTTLTLNAGSQTLKVQLPSSSQHTVSLDCTTHVVRVDGKVSGVTLDSDWPDLSPGRWRVMVSSGTATFSWTQRYR